MDAWWKGLAGAAGLIAGALLFGLVLLVAHGNSARDTAHERERRSYDILLVVRGLDSSLAHGEAALGRFVINGKPETGTLYYDDWKQAGRELTRLAQLTADNPRQAKLVQRLEKAYDQRSSELAAPATRAFYKQGWAALSLFEKAGNSAAITEITKILEQIEANEREILDKRASSAADRADWTNRLSNLLSGMGLLILLSAGLLGWLAYNALQQRKAARLVADVQADRAALLTEAVAARTSELVEVNEKLRAEAETRAAAEAQLRQIQKMEAVGQLTGGIAHDFNNMLAVVVGALDLARRRLTSEPGEIGRHIENALEGANRAASLTRRLMSFARAEPLLPAGIGPGELIRDMSSLLDRTLGERIRIATSGLDGRWLVWADPHQLENAIINLAINARDAMEGEGDLAIDAAELALAGGEIGGLAAGDYIRITVTDTGCGMTQEVLERAFEPFYTTKPVGKGTGLGLSQVFGFARQSHGEIMMQSEPGRGTSVAMYLPRHRAVTDTKRLAAIDGASAEELARHGSLSILVVEDDPRVRAATVAALAELGHRPIACGAGEDALVVLANTPDIALLITDVVMPGMTGPELANEVARRYPAIAILYVTGYAGEAGEAESFTQHELLRKPFTINALARAILIAMAPSISESPHLSADAAAE